MGDGILVAITVIVVDKSSHANLERLAGDGVISCGVRLLIVCVDEDAAIEVPYWRRRFAALPCSKHWAVFAVLVVAVGDTHLGFYSIDGKSEHVALDRRHISVETKGTTNDAGEVDDDPIVTRSGIIREF
jgi:hypothetical protein